MKIQTSWKAAASDTSVHRGTCMLDFKNIPCRIKIPTRKIRTVSQIPNLSFFFILFMLSTRIKLLQVHLGPEVWGVIIMDSRVSATGLKSVELDELTTNQITTNNEGLHYLHE